MYQSKEKFMQKCNKMNNIKIYFVQVHIRFIVLTVKKSMDEINHLKSELKVQQSKRIRTLHTWLAKKDLAIKSKEKIF